MVLKLKKPKSKTVLPIACDDPPSQVAETQAFQQESSTACEDAVFTAFIKKANSKPLTPGLILEVNEDGGIMVSLDNPNGAVGFVQLMEAIGTTDASFLDGLLGQIIVANSANRKVSSDNVNFMLSVVKDIEPRDQLEAMMATQMAAVHMQTMELSRRLAVAETLPQQDSAERALNKLARTFAAQLTALKKYRSSGEQKVTVEHVTVGDGGQAIVGNVEMGGMGSGKK